MLRTKILLKHNIPVHILKQEF